MPARQEYLLADLRPEWKGDIFRRDSSEALMVRTAGLGLWGMSTYATGRHTASP